MISEHDTFAGTSFSDLHPLMQQGRALRGQASGAVGIFELVPDDLLDLGVRQKQIVVDHAPAFLGAVDHAQPELLELRLLSRADSRHAAGHPT